MSMAYFNGDSLAVDEHLLLEKGVSFGWDLTLRISGDEERGVPLSFNAVGSVRRRHPSTNESCRTGTFLSLIHGSAPPPRMPARPPPGALFPGPEVSQSGQPEGRCGSEGD
jgi:hypothetical protein